MGNGWMVKEMDMAHFTMQMDQNMKDNGRIIWNKEMQYLQMNLGSARKQIFIMIKELINRIYNNIWKIL